MDGTEMKERKQGKRRTVDMPDDGGIPTLLPPSDDRVFKLLLSHGDAEPVLKDVVSAVIGRKVRKVFLRNNEIPATDIFEKQERLDVNCVTDDGEQIDLEMQASRIEETGDDRHANLKRKSLYYLCDLHSSQGLKGKTYAQLARTWQVTFCAYTVFPGDRKFFRTATMRGENGNVLTDDITMAFVELGKARDFAKKPVNELTPLEMWTIFFGYANRPEYGKVMEAIFRKKKEVDMAGTLLKSISKDERERAHFRSRRMFQTDMEHNLITAKQNGIDIGEKRGISIGEKRGISIGEKRGISIGEKRGEERAVKRHKGEREEAARTLMSNGVPVEIIIKSMKLTPDEKKALGLRNEKKLSRK
jgi:predicted transposase/invertase (TIGR01784 family)